MSPGTSTYHCSALTQEDVLCPQENFGRDSMIMQLVMSQHARLMHAALDREFAVGEAILKQHIRWVSCEPKTTDIIASNTNLMCGTLAGTRQVCAALESPANHDFWVDLW